MLVGVHELVEESPGVGRDANRSGKTGRYFIVLNSDSEYELSWKRVGGIGNGSRRGRTGRASVFDVIDGLPSWEASSARMWAWHMRIFSAYSSSESCRVTFSVRLSLACGLCVIRQGESASPRELCRGKGGFVVIEAVEHAQHAREDSARAKIAHRPASLSVEPESTPVKAARLGEAGQPRLQRR